MIHLARPPAPNCLVQNGERWTARWRDSLAEGRNIEWATPAAKRDLRDPLLGLSRGKCAFCESTLNVTSFIEIEHYQSKRLQPQFTFEWQNLFPCCGMCNQNKGDLDHQNRLIKPDLNDPEPLLWLNPGNGELEPHPTLGPAQIQRVLETIEAYNLRRGALCAQRIEMMDAVNRWLARVANELGDSEECKQEWRLLTKPSTPWKFVIRHILTLRGQAELAEVDRALFANPH